MARASYFWVRVSAFPPLSPKYAYTPHIETNHRMDPFPSRKVFQWLNAAKTCKMKLHTRVRAVPKSTNEMINHVVKLVTDKKHRAMMREKNGYFYKGRFLNT